MAVMDVFLMAYTPDPGRVCGAAAKVCVSSRDPREIWDSTPREKLLGNLEAALSRGHESVSEHAYFTFAVSGVSRALTHQLVRHRVASYSQQSQRYVKLARPRYVTPPTVKGDSEAERLYREAVESAFKAYKRLMDLGVPLEDARYVLPNAAETSIVVSVNARELLHILELRLCLHAQWEIRMLASKMLQEASKVAPEIMARAGPPCKTKGRCPENDAKCPLYAQHIGGGASPSAARDSPGQTGSLINPSLSGSGEGDTPGGGI
ncbi:MAG: FAD-dependent thymidylate synthase [Candidatus Bathyarchaeia archaeon]